MKKDKIKKNRLSSNAVISIKGLNQEKMLNAISQQCDVYNIERKDKHNTKFEVHFKECKKVQKLIKSSGIEVVSINYRGIYSFFRKALTSYGVIFALIVSACFYGLEYQYFLGYEIAGASKQVEGKIEEFLKSNVKFNKKSKINTKNVELLLKNNFDEISSVSVAYVGQKMVININEAVLPEEMTTVFKPIVSQYDCLITKIDLVQGHALCKVGQLIRRGQTLVEGKVIDSQGNERNVRPIATIYADVFLTEQVSHSESYYLTERTGRKIVQSNISLFGIPIYSRTPENNFLDYEIEKIQENLTKNLILPLKLNKLYIYELKTTLIEKSFEEVKNEKIDEARKKVLQKLNKNEIINNETYNIINMGGIYYVDYTICVNRTIGVVDEN